VSLIKGTLRVAFVLCLFHQFALGQQSYGADLAAVAGFTTGKNAGFYTPGFGVVGGFFFDLESNIRLGLVLGYIHFGLDGDAVRDQYALQGGTGTIEASGGVGGIPILISVRLITPDASGPRFYGLLEAGLYAYSTSISGSITENSQVAPIDNSEFRSEPGIALGIGGMLPVGTNLYADGSIKYNLVRDSQFSTSGNTPAIGTSQFLTIALGISYSFPL